jgi:hypothetical protein
MSAVEAIKARLDQAILNDEPKEFIDGLSVALDIAADEEAK